MNILIVGSDFKPLAGGVAEYTHRLALHLHKASDNVMVLSENTNNAESFDITCPYSVYRHNLRFLASGTIRKYYTGYKWLKNFVKAHYPIDIIISNCHEISSIVASTVSKSLNIPFAIFTHGSEINRKELKEQLKIKFVLRSATKVFCNSSFTRGVAMKLGVPRNRTAVVPGGISIDEFAASHRRSRSTSAIDSRLQGKRVIFTCGRLVERKGHDMVIKALPRILQKVSNAVYLITGEGPYEARLKEFVNEYRLKEHVIFTGYVDDSRRQEFYRACDVFAMPCRELKNGRVEGFGLVFLEANAFCKPVVAGRAGGAVDAVKHNETGLLVNPSDVNEIAEAIIYLLIHPEIAAQMGKNGRQRIERELTWDISGAKLRQELTRLLAQTLD
jgi:phosphatidylinositol alpha-1,6-mannosyltransferase